MKIFDLEEYQAPGKANTRVSAARGQNFRFRYREGKFYFSNAVWDEFNLEQKGLSIRIHPVTNDVLLQVVENEQADMLKRTPKTGASKSKMIKAIVLENALAKVGLIDLTAKGNQFLDFEVGQSKQGDTVLHVIKGHKLKGSDIMTDEEAAVEDTKEVTADNSVASVNDDSIPDTSPNEPSDEDFFDDLQDEEEPDFGDELNTPSNF